MANITLSVDEKTVSRARDVARLQGTSLNALIREYLERLAGQQSGDLIVSELDRLWAEGGGRSGGEVFRREDAYEGRLG